MMDPVCNCALDTAPLASRGLAATRRRRSSEQQTADENKISSSRGGNHARARIGPSSRPAHRNRINSGDAMRRDEMRCVPAAPWRPNKK